MALICFCLLVTVFVPILFWARRLKDQRYCQKNPEPLLAALPILTCPTPWGPAAYSEQGRGPTVVFLHGLGASRFVWADMYTDLAKDHRVLALDLLGFGQSPRPKSSALGLREQTEFVQTVLKAANVKHFVFVASSMGGAIALAVSQALGQGPSTNGGPKAEGAILISPALDQNHGPWHFLSGLAPLFSLFVNSWLCMAIVRRVRSQRNISQAMLYMYLRPYVNSPDDIRCFLKSTAILNSSRRSLCSSAAWNRSLIIWGDADKILSVPKATARLSFFGEARFEVLKGSHHLMEDQPLALSQRTREFLRSIEMR